MQGKRWISHLLQSFLILFHFSFQPVQIVRYGKLDTFHTGSILTADLFHIFIYGGIMNPASILMSYGYITPASLVAFYISGIPVDLVHALSTVIFLWFLSRPLLEKLERIKKKYGLIESGKEEML